MGRESVFASQRISPVVVSTAVSTPAVSMRPVPLLPYSIADAPVASSATLTVPSCALSMTAGETSSETQ